MADGEATISIRDRLLKERNALLDLSIRNRLLNTPLRTKNNRAIEIVDEKAEEVFRLLTSNKALSFVPGIQLSEADLAELDPDDDDTGGLPQPGEDATDERGVASRHSDAGSVMHDTRSCPLGKTCKRMRVSTTWRNYGEIRVELGGGRKQCRRTTW